MNDCATPDCGFHGLLRQPDESREDYLARMRAVYWAAVERSRETCRNGHPRTAENTYYARDGWRRCRQCRGR